jgi:hypothetical protein
VAVALVEKRLKDPATAQHFSATDLLSSMRAAPSTHGFAPGVISGRIRQPGGVELDNPVPELALATREYARQNGVDVFTAMHEVAVLRKDLSEAVWNQFQRSRGNGR